jgi:caffeoyl-CoA O-methyltransferase
MLSENESLLKYIFANSSVEDPLLAELYRETHLKVLNPRMASGHLQGKVLEFISHMIRPQYILEIGTYTGYSAICLAKGLRPDGKLITIEKNDEIIHFASKYFHKANLCDKIELAGDAATIIPELEYEFDLAFIDGDKKEYLEYYQLAKAKMKKGGFIIADNVLWSGKVLDTPNTNDKETQSVIRFNKMICNDSEVENIILPIRDGLNLIRIL